MPEYIILLLILVGGIGGLGTLYGQKLLLRSVTSYKDVIHLMTVTFGLQAYLFAIAFLTAFYLENSSLISTISWIVKAVEHLSYTSGLIILSSALFIILANLTQFLAIASISTVIMIVIGLLAFISLFYSETSLLAILWSSGLLGSLFVLFLSIVFSILDLTTSYTMPYTIGGFAVLLSIIVATWMLFYLKLQKLR